MKPLFVPLPGNEPMAARLASLLDGELGSLELHVFPDGECLPRFTGAVLRRAVVLVCTLDRPNEKVLSLLFAADAARELGAASLGLVAPYLCYMRQDRRFQAGEAITSRSFARLVDARFDWLVTVDPHLHRYHALSDIYAIPALAAHAAPALADWLRANVQQPFLIGPDEESRQWVAAVAAACGAPWDVLRKEREGDRSVILRTDHLRLPAGVTPVLLDDIIASGATVLQALRAVRRQVASPVVVAAVHYLGGARLERELSRRGARLVACNTVSHQAACIDVMPIVAQGISTFAGGSRPAVRASEPGPACSENTVGRPPGGNQETGRPCQKLVRRPIVK